MRALNQARGKQFSLPLPSLAQLSLPLIGRVAAGSPILAQEHVDRTFLMEASMFARRPDYLLKVRGMSMKDAGIMDGDLLAVQKASEAKNGQIVVARLGDDVTVKALQAQPRQHRAAAREPRFSSRSWSAPATNSRSKAWPWASSATTCWCEAPAAGANSAASAPLFIASERWPARTMEASASCRRVPPAHAPDLPCCVCSAARRTGPGPGWTSRLGRLAQLEHAAGAGRGTRALAATRAHRCARQGTP